MRIDKLLGNMGYGSRKQLKVLLKKKFVTVNGKHITNGSTHVSPASDIVQVDGQKVNYRKYVYIMLYKPKGYISATEDDRNKTVLDLLPDDVKKFKPSPVGRLDKDTEGLLFMTNDGTLNHELTTPKNAVPKKYTAVIEGDVTAESIRIFHDGIILDDGQTTRPANLEIISHGEESEVNITITEGKFHQIKRMFQAIDRRVLFLKRVQIGPLVLDTSLKTGSYRELSDEELANLKRANV